MNRFVHEFSEYTLKTFSGFSKANIHIKGKKNIPEGAIIFCANHFTRIETVFLPLHIHSITQKKICSLAAGELFQVPVLDGILNKLGAVSTHDPKRDELILKALLSGDTQWIIFPEGMMVKNKKLIKKDNFILTDDKGVMRPHTGAAVLALRCEFLRERLRRLSQKNMEEFLRLKDDMEIDDMDRLFSETTSIVPVNITYYPGNPRENILGTMAKILMKDPSKRMMDELLTEGGMLLAGVDITIRFGKPIHIHPFLNDPYIESMLTARRRVRFEEDIYSKAISRSIANKIMQGYMSAVYSMTTLNFDHVMACILKHYPYKKEGIDLYEFRCKVYYGITCLVLNRICHVVDTFHLNQIHLLINDRFERISRFLSIAQKTGLIRIEGSRIFKDQAMFHTKFEFHSIRIENPVLVMANEVEPVVQADTCLKKIAQKSRYQIMEQVSNRLIEKMNVDYSLAYSKFYIEGESKKKRVGRPIFLKHNQESPGVLLIHGYMAAPAEMRQFAEHLHRSGFNVYAPRLAGHCTAPEDLADTNWEQWAEAVEEGYVVLRHNSSSTIIGGFSTGAGLALELACRLDDYSAIFAVAPPMKLNDLGSYFIPAINAWNGMIKRINLPGIAKEFIENRPENPHINYLRNPIAGIRQLEKLMDQLDSKLKAITKPVLVVQSRNDPVVSPSGTQKLFKKLGSEKKELYLFDYDRHGILIGRGVERIFQAIESFIRLWV